MELKLSFGEHLDALGFRKRISLYHLPSCVRVFVCVYVCDSRGSSLRRRRRRRAVVLLQLIFRQKPVNRQASVEAVGRRHQAHRMSLSTRVESYGADFYSAGMRART